MSGAFPIAAIQCQLAAVSQYALENDAMRLHIRGALRDVLALVERDGGRLAGAECAGHRHAHIPRHGRRA
jgi:hypothetical protein